MTIECFILLLIMMNSPQGLNDRDKDIDEFIKQEKDNPNFKEMFDKIMGGGSSTKKVDAFLGGDQMMAQDFNNPAGLPQDLYEATMRQYGRKEFGDYTTDDMKLIIEAQKNKGLV